jgi:hypothetical protein
VAAQLPDMFCNFYFVESCQITNTSATTKAREKISTYLVSLEFFDVCLIKSENYKVLLIIHRSLVMATKQV